MQVTYWRKKFYSGGKKNRKTLVKGIPQDDINEKPTE